MLPFGAVETPARSALVTGAGSGIGRAVAIGLLDQGYQVALVGRRVALLEETAATVPDAAGRVLVVPADVTDPEAVIGAFDTAVARFGRLDLLVNNAGVSAPAVPLE
jgi:NAD(P)-dependent dehydrogenase (short-subunit alcohol dehydrogenase family)